MTGMRAREALAPESPLRRLRRDEALALCRAAAQDWDPGRQRNLALFFDGTGNILGDSSPTNVVRLWAAAERSARQVCYYDPGVGTPNQAPPATLAADWRQRGERLVGMALGGGVHDNIMEGYRFLVDQYQEGDRIFLFGFSRGAFTARAVAGMVNMFGLIHHDGLSMLPTMVNTYFADPDRGPEARLARERFTDEVHAFLARGRFPLLHFVGAWDTVETVGGMTGRRITNSGGVDDKRFVHIRHALALHETRAQYRPRPYQDPHYTPEECACRSFRQCWFRGVHSDVGGSFLEHGLSDLALRWMLEEAQGCGLRIDPAAPWPTGEPAQPMHDQTLACPLWALSGVDTRRRPVDESLHRSAVPLAGAVPAGAVDGARACRHANTVSACQGRGWRWLGLLAGLGALGFVAALVWVGARQGVAWHDWLAAAGAVPPAPMRRVLALAGLAQLCAGVALAWPLAWCARRLAPAAIAAGQRLPRLARVAHVPLLALLLLGGAAALLGLHGVFVLALPFALATGAWSAAVQWREAMTEATPGSGQRPAHLPAWLGHGRWLAGGLVALLLMTALHYLLGWPVLAFARWAVLWLGALAALAALATLLWLGARALAARGVV